MKSSKQLLCAVLLIAAAQRVAASNAPSLFDAVYGALTNACPTCDPNTLAGQARQITAKCGGIANQTKLSASPALQSEQPLCFAELNQFCESFTKQQ
jgi:hypothetical protein